MKRFNLIILAILAALGMGCAEDKNSGGSNGNPVVVLDPADFTPYIPETDWDEGATANLNFTNADFYAGWTPNSLQNARINLNLQKFAPASGSDQSSYGGTVSISFEDNGYYYEDNFSSLVNENHWYGAGTVSSNKENNRYNIWFTKNGDDVWHGFFQDSYGAIIIVIDETDDEGDGQGPSVVSGSVYVMNFPNKYNSIVFGASPTSCWFVKAGPYDCRTWKSGNGVDTTKDIYPYLENSSAGSFSAPKSEGYRKVGEFRGMSFQDAFGN